MAVICIGDGLNEAPLPESLDVTLTDVGARLRSASGVSITRVNRAALRTLTLVWRNISAEDAAALLTELSKPGFLLKYPDPLTGGYRQARFFCARREAQVSYAVDGAAVLDTLRAVCEEV